jgi:hypothetical protein
VYADVELVEEQRDRPRARRAARRVQFHSLDRLRDATREKLEVRGFQIEERPSGTVKDDGVDPHGRQAWRILPGADTRRADETNRNKKDGDPLPHDPSLHPAAAIEVEGWTPPVVTAAEAAAPNNGDGR